MLESTNASLFKAGDLILIDAEIFKVGQVTGNSITVSERALGGTTAAQHLPGASVVLFYPGTALEKAIPASTAGALETVSVASVSGFKVGHTIAINDEFMFVASVDVTNKQLGVYRGYSQSAGTKTPAQAAGSLVGLYNPTTAVARIKAAVTAADTSITVFTTRGFTANMYIQIDEEIMKITSLTSTSFTVLRGQAQTTAAAHVVGAEYRSLTLETVTLLPTALASPLAKDDTSMTVISFEGMKVGLYMHMYDYSYDDGSNYFHEIVQITSITGTTVGIERGLFGTTVSIRDPWPARTVVSIATSVFKLTSDLTKCTLPCSSTIESSPSYPLDTTSLGLAIGDYLTLFFDWYEILKVTDFNETSITVDRGVFGSGTNNWNKGEPILTKLSSATSLPKYYTDAYVETKLPVLPRLQGAVGSDATSITLADVSSSQSGYSSIPGGSYIVIDTEVLYVPTTPTSSTFEVQPANITNRTEHAKDAYVLVVGNPSYLTDAISDKADTIISVKDNSGFQPGQYVVVYNGEMNGNKKDSPELMLINDVLTSNQLNVTRGINPIEAQCSGLSWCYQPRAHSSGDVVFVHDNVYVNSQTGIAPGDYVEMVIAFPVVPEIALVTASSPNLLNIKHGQFGTLSFFPFSPWGGWMSVASRYGLRSAILVAPLTNNATFIIVNDATGLFQYDVIAIGQELLQITSLANNLVGVTRSVQGSLATSHAQGSSVTYVRSSTTALASSPTQTAAGRRLLQTVSAGISASATQIAVSGTMPAQGTNILVDDEVMLVLAVDKTTSTITVARAQQGTAAAAHSASAEIELSIGAQYFMSTIIGATGVLQSISGSNAGLYARPLITNPDTTDATPMLYLDGLAVIQSPAKLPSAPVLSLNYLAPALTSYPGAIPSLIMPSVSYPVVYSPAKYSSDPLYYQDRMDGYDLMRPRSAVLEGSSNKINGTSPVYVLDSFGQMLGDHVTGSETLRVTLQALATALATTPVLSSSVSSTARVTASYSITQESSSLGSVWGAPSKVYSPFLGYSIKSVAASGTISPAALSNAVLDSTSTTVTLSASVTFITSGSYIRIDNEVMLVTAVAGSSLTVVRGQRQTYATTHAAQASVYSDCVGRLYAEPSLEGGEPAVLDFDGNTVTVVSGGSGYLSSSKIHACGSATRCDYSVATANTCSLTFTASLGSAVQEVYLNNTVAARALGGQLSGLTSSSSRFILWKTQSRKVSTTLPSSTPASPSATTATTTPAGSSINVGAIVGGVIGGVAGAALLGFLAYKLLAPATVVKSPVEEMVPVYLPQTYPVLPVDYASAAPMPLQTPVYGQQPMAYGM
ncbi:hypothetical protein GUITHDRAFT_120759 [Guillardia theta CCMP2712]|uniref:Uncharacterized protein n=1 Tax=Guillardia theta (strain CCMP2712) TaxID=905079 RepID=L1IB36_GUITC|nr:hypothetical protein GUITHDRAFT_120759 [Guillardia theta CCMP2712]EKX33065.1 hypothetical protein GUITHDRAFT_120759 [Guillardia theta CCMP2712]|eukprot:XP_005820045.1 hypothetical protein GUITHDRAFT_120759 [Guillardia theta CCMP2712]